jgi:site-specific DNA-methyltransferase (adenine-specific)
MDKTRVFNADCLPAMREFPDKYFDLAIVDPPYGIGIVAPGKRTLGKLQPGLTKYKSANWDLVIPSIEYFDELFRVSGNQIIFGGNYFAHLLPPSKGWIVWDKPQPDGVSFAQAELMWSSFDISIKRYGGAKRSEIGNCVSNNNQLAQINAKIHPTQKPKSLYKWLLKNYAKEGDKILDTHLGSGSSRIAAYDMGFRFWGYELDVDYFNAQEKRFQQHKAQLKLFEVK